MTEAETTTTPKPPHRLAVWSIVAVLLAVVLVLWDPKNVSQVLGKILAVPSGGAMGCLLFDTLMPYARPSAFLSEPWHLTMAFKEGEPDFKIVAGKETLFIACCAFKALFILGGAYIVGLGN